MPLSLSFNTTWSNNMKCCEYFVNFYSCQCQTKLTQLRLWRILFVQTTMFPITLMIIKVDVAMKLIVLIMMKGNLYNENRRFHSVIVLKFQILLTLRGLHGVDRGLWCFQRSAPSLWLNGNSAGFCVVFCTVEVVLSILKEQKEFPHQYEKRCEKIES